GIDLHGHLGMALLLGAVWGAGAGAVGALLAWGSGVAGHRGTALARGEGLAGAGRFDRLPEPPKTSRTCLSVARWQDGKGWVGQGDMNRTCFTVPQLAYAP
ncbi:hypothetical protein ABZ281_44140, partial [Streptomyces sp. NPDC006265]